MITYSPARSRVPRPEVRRLVTAVLTALLTVLALGLAGAVPASAAADYTQGVTSTGSGSVQIWFKPTTPASLVDVHYLSPSAGQQNFRMANNAGIWQQNVGGLPSGFTLEYWFTYEKGGPLYDTPHFTYTVGSGGGGGGGGGTGSFPITFQNNTRGTYANSQIYVTVLGQVTPGQWSYMKSDGTMTRINHLDANAPGHLTKNGVNYPNMSFTLAQSGGSVPSPRRSGAAGSTSPSARPCTSRSPRTTRAGAAPTCATPTTPTPTSTTTGTSTRTSSGRWPSAATPPRSTSSASR